MATIDPASLQGATTSLWKMLANSTIMFTRVVSEITDPITGNPRPFAKDTLTIRAYMRKARLVTEEGHGVPIGTYKVEGYTVGVLPDWAKIPSALALPCTIDNLGKGFFTFQGKIIVVKEQVEAIGKGSQIQGFFTIQGSN